MQKSVGDTTLAGGCDTETWERSRRFSPCTHLPIADLSNDGWIRQSAAGKRKLGGLFGPAQLIVASLDLVGRAPKPQVYTAFEIRAHAHTTSMDCGMTNAVAPYMTRFGYPRDAYFLSVDVGFISP